MRWDTNTKEKNKAVKLLFDAMDKGIEMVSKEGIIGMITLLTLWFG